MFGILKHIFGTQQTRLLKKYHKMVRQVNVEEQKLFSLSDEELKGKTAEFRSRLARGETIDTLLPEAYAVVKSACRRLCGTEVHVSGYNQKWDMIPYDVQILGGIALHYGAIAEMQTGEGKTLTASMPLYLNALTGKPVHLVTVNDYLAARDCEWIGAIFRFLGLSVQALTNQTAERKLFYEADIVYGTASEFAFDYLRDNSMAQRAEDQCQRGHYFAIIDEVDSILIDEARTPLIISGPAAGSKQMYGVLKEPVAGLIRFQRDLCTKLATDARKVLEKYDRLKERSSSEEPPKKVKKEEEAEVKEAFRKLWLVGKGMPRNKILKRIKENPEMREAIDVWDVYYYGEQNKEEKAAALAELYIVIDERGSEYELTDKGMHLWAEMGNSKDDFVMLDLGYEYAKIDHDTLLSAKDKLEKKVALREEDAGRKEKAHNIRQLLRAHLLMEKDIEYIISEGKVVIIDENTGRPQPGRRFSDGLHQAIEAKEGVEIQGETQIYATTTLQNYFRLYSRLAGMTGTAMTEATEFKEIYKLDVLAIPTHRTCLRIDANDEVYMTEREKFHALLNEVKQIHEQGRPILIGTGSVEASEKTSRILKQNKLQHSVLNAKNHAHEAEIIASAGQPQMITVATNMAGRGVDIKLGDGVAALGGLHVIGTERSETRRVDRQLRGRCARQGDPGSSKFLASFEDDLLRRFTPPRVAAFLNRFRPAEGEPIAAKVLNRSLETAQKRVEQRNYQMRKRTLEYDDVIVTQRDKIYKLRNKVLHHASPIQIAEEMIEDLFSQKVQQFFIQRGSPGEWNPEGFCEWITTNFPVTFEVKEFDNDYLQTPEIERNVVQRVVQTLHDKVAYEEQAIETAQKLAGKTQNSKNRHLEQTFSYAEELLKEVIRNILIRSIDRKWQEHLLQIDHLKTEIHLRASVGQKDPLLEFKQESSLFFDRFVEKLMIEALSSLFKFHMAIPQGAVERRAAPKEDHPSFRMSLSLMPEIETEPE